MSTTTTMTGSFQSDSINIHSTNDLTKANVDVTSGDSKTSPIFSPSDSEQTAATLLRDPAYTSNDTLNLLHEASQRSEREHASAVGGNSRSAGLSGKQTSIPFMANATSTYSEADGNGTGVDAALKAWTNVRFVRSGLFSAEEALAFVDHFYTFLAPFSPIPSSVFKHPSRHPKLIEEEPILTVTILMLSARCVKLAGPGALSRSYVIHERMWKYLQGMITRVFWSEEHSIGRVGPVTPFSQTDSSSYIISSPSIFRSLGTCEALLLLLEWHPRALHFPSIDDDTTSIVVRDTGITHPSQKNIGQYGRLRSGIDWLARSDRMCWSLLGTALSVAVELGVFDEKHHTAKQPLDDRDVLQDPSRDHRVYRIQKLIWAYSIQTSGRLGWKHLTPFPIVERYLAPEDDTTNCWVGVSTLLKKAIDLLFPCRDHTKEIVKNGEYVKHLQSLQPLLQDWEKVFDDARLSRSMRSMLAIEYGYVRVYAYSVALQAITERRIRDLDLRNTESQVMSDQEITDIEHLRQITAAARSILRTVVYDIVGSVAYIPVRTYSRILAGSLCLLKTCAIGINKTEAGISLEMVDAAAEALRNSVTDDLNLCTRWGELLQTLSSNLRERIEQISAANGSLKKDATPIHSAPAGNRSSTNSDPSSFGNNPNPLFEASRQNINTAATTTLADPDIFSANCVYYPGANQVTTDVNGGASGWDDLSLWLDPLGHASAGNVGQMSWHGDGSMYGMPEPLMSCLGVYFNSET